MAKSLKPTQPPKSADYSALVKKVNEVAAKAGVTPLSSANTTAIPRHKRWVGGEAPDYDGTGLRDVVQANAVFLDDVKVDLDDFKENNGIAHASFARRLAAIEAQLAASPFPG
jgi:hypothetical protein